MAKNSWASRIDADPNKGVDEKEVEAINRFLARIPVVAQKYAEDNDTDVTLRMVQAALEIMRSVFKLDDPSDAEALQQQISRVVQGQGRTALPAAQQPNSSQQLQPYTGGQPPAVVQGANAALQRVVLSLFTRVGVPIHMPHSGQLDITMLDGFFQEAMRNIAAMEQRANEANDLQQQLDQFRQQSSPQHLAPLGPAPINPAPVSPQSDPPTDGFILRDTLAAILRNLDEDLEIGQGGASTPWVKHPSGRLGLGSSVSPEDQETRENAFQGAWGKIRELAGLTGRRTRRDHRS